MNILISVNKNYLPPAEVMLGSLARRVNEHINVYLLNKSLTASDIDSFSKKLKKIKQTIVLHTINTPSSYFDKLPVTLHFSKEMYYRIIAQFILPDNLDRILWLDADIIILKDITDFYHQDFNNAYLIACPDINNTSAVIVSQKKSLELPKEHLYFNSGVLLMNLNLMRKHTNLETIYTCATPLKDKLLYPDQDILNVLYHNKVKYAEFTLYNYQTLNFRKFPKQILSDIFILHYIGSIKPWNNRFLKNHAKFWWKEALQNGGWFFRYILWHIRFSLYKIFHPFKWAILSFAKKILHKNPPTAK